MVKEQLFGYYNKKYLSADLDFFYKMIIFVTGGAGFIGSNFINKFFEYIKTKGITLQFEGLTKKNSFENLLCCLFYIPMGITCTSLQLLFYCK